MNNEYHSVNESKLKIVGKTRTLCTLNDCSRKVELLIVGNETMISPIVLGRDTLVIFGLGIRQKYNCLTERGNELQSVQDHLNEIMHIDVEQIVTGTELDVNPQIHYEYKRQLENSF